jgi:hypothetical protein
MDFIINYPKYKNDIFFEFVTMWLFYYK